MGKDCGFWREIRFEEAFRSPLLWEEARDRRAPKFEEELRQEEDGHNGQTQNHLSTCIIFGHELPFNYLLKT